MALVSIQRDRCPRLHARFLAQRPFGRQTQTFERDRRGPARSVPTRPIAISLSSWNVSIVIEGSPVQS